MSFLKTILGKDDEQPASMTERLKKLYMEVLKERSDVKEVCADDDGDVSFEVEDMGTLYVSVLEDDPEFFHLVYPNFLDNNQALEDFGADVPTLFRAVNQTRRRCKAANVFLRWDKNDSTWNAFVTIEAFIAAADELPTKEQIEATFDRNLGAIGTAIHALVQELRGDEAQDNSDDDTPTHQ